MGFIGEFECFKFGFVGEFEDCKLMYEGVGILLRHEPFGSGGPLSLLLAKCFRRRRKLQTGKKAALRDRLCRRENWRLRQFGEVASDIRGPLGILLRVGVFALKMRKNSSPLSVYGKSASICASRTRRTS